MDPFLQRLREGNVNDEIEVIARLKKADQIPVKLNIVVQFDNIITGRIKRGDIDKVWADKKIVSLKAPRIIHQSLLSKSGTNLKKKKIINSFTSGAVIKPLVVVGIADWYFDFTHWNFRNKDGSTRFLAIWDQTASFDGYNHYGYGRVHTQSQINKALKSNTPFKELNYFVSKGAHGTFCLDIAAGNGTVGYQGNAPNAALVAVHLGTSKLPETLSLGDQGRLLESVHFMHHIANKTPLVINLSVGAHGDHHMGRSLVEKGFDKFLLKNKGRCIVQSCGNYHMAKTHASGRITSGGERWLDWEIPFQDSTTNELEIWYSGKDRFRISLFNEKEGLITTSLPNNNAVIFNKTGEKIGQIYHRTCEPNTFLNHVDIFIYKNANALNLKLKIFGENVVDGRFYSWIERDGTSKTQSQFNSEDVDTSITLGSICNGFYTIAVGAYDDRSPTYEVAEFSSGCRTADGRIKPDCLAPGVDIVAAKSSSINKHFPKGELTVKSGTSMAAPYVAGAIAEMFQEIGSSLSIHQTRKLLFNSLDKHQIKNEENCTRVGNGYINIERLLINAKNLKNNIMDNQTRSFTRQNSNSESVNNLMEIYDNRIRKYASSYSPIFRDDNMEKNIGEEKATVTRFQLTINTNTNRPIRFPKNVVREDLKAVRYATSYVKFNAKYVKEGIDISKNWHGSWTRRIPNYSQFIKSLGTIKLGVELVKLDFPQELDINKFITPEFNDYLRSMGIDTFISFLYPLRNRNNIERAFHIDLSELVKNKPFKSAKNDNFFFLIYIIFPNTVYKSGHVINVKQDLLNYFAHNSSLLSEGHKKRLWFLARYIVESWNYRLSFWKFFKPVSQIYLSGAGDATGSKTYNDELGLKRAKNVQKKLKEYIDNIWRKTTGNSNSLASKILINSRSIGNRRALAAGEKNKNPRWRGVEITINHEEKGSIKILKIIEELLALFQNHTEEVKKLMRADEAKVVKCILNKLKKPFVNDLIAKYPTGVYDRSKLEPKDFHSARSILFSGFILRTTRSIEEKLKRAFEIHRAIKKNNSDMERIAARHGATTDRKIQRLLQWTRQQIRNRKSIYSCYNR